MKKVILVIGGLLVVLQFFRIEKNQGELYGPNHISKVVPVPAEVEGILQTACYDCHSNHTNYPWYSEIQPVAGWLQHHVNEGNAELNFSEFAAYSPKKQNHKLEEVSEVVGEGEMPLESYTYMHTEATLTEAQINTLLTWARASRAKIMQ